MTMFGEEIEKIDFSFVGGLRLIRLVVLCVYLIFIVAVVCGLAGIDFFKYLYPYVKPVYDIFEYLGI